ncbi:MAG: molybdate transport system substrate-binding protein [Thiomicrorhabdus sp.]|nr:MAG: molybdate transport system substrate-binding protein [Thiomicrorhabdus sp.]
MKNHRIPSLLLMSCLLGSFSNTYASQSVHIAVASNFLVTLKSLSKAFTRETGIKVHLSNGASGMLYSKIRKGAPYDLFFSADAKRPQLLEQQGFIEVDSRFTYVVGRLVVWSPDTDKLSPDLAELKANDPNLRFIAVANPKTAPYGIAAMAVLKHYGLYHSLAEQNKIALGESVGKAYQYTATGNAQLGLIAKSYVSNPDRAVSGRVFDVPIHLYPALSQQAVVLKGRNTSEVKRFLKFFLSDKVQKKIKSYGYGSEQKQIPFLEAKE